MVGFRQIPSLAVRELKIRVGAIGVSRHVCESSRLAGGPSCWSTTPASGGTAAVDRCDPRNAKATFLAALSLE